MIGIAPGDLLVHGEFRKSCAEDHIGLSTCHRCKAQRANQCGRCLALTTQEAQIELACATSLLLHDDIEHTRGRKRWLPLLPVPLRLAWEVFICEAQLRTALNSGGHDAFMQALRKAEKMKSPETTALNHAIDDAQQFLRNVQTAQKMLSKKLSDGKFTGKGNALLVAWDEFVNASHRWSMAMGFVDDVFHDLDIRNPDIWQLLADNCDFAEEKITFKTVASLLATQDFDVIQLVQVLTEAETSKPRFLKEVVETLVLEIKLRRACILEDESLISSSVKDAQRHSRQTKALQELTHNAVEMLQKYALERVKGASGMELLRNIINCEKLGLRDAVAADKARYFDCCLYVAPRVASLPQWMRSGSDGWQYLSASECVAYERKFQANEWSDASKAQGMRRIPLRLPLPAHWGELNESTREMFEHLLDVTTHTEHEFLQCHKVRKATVLKVEHVRNLRLWNQYLFKRRLLRDSTEPIRALSPAVCEELQMHQCDPRLNEAYLFHGTTQDTVESISHRGFDTKLCCSLHGFSLNFSSYPCRALLYPNSGRPKNGTRTLILTRVLLGDPCYTTETKPGLRRPTNRSEDKFDPYDCIVANPGPLKGAPGDRQVHQDFHIYDSWQTYPEFILTIQLPTT
eukprot:GEMP01010613.1.p1 GENE.GEMP01010613.1~~GEMP01010613.1.p1  ORF type:complete len:631 (+),score=124.14 GEMP01010613.1:198-2090(+)